MALNERQDGILGIIKEQKKVTVPELASIFFVSEATIRRDLAEMKDMGLVERSHGGAFLPENSEEEVFINVMVLNRQFLLNLIDEAVLRAYKSFENDIILQQLNGLKIFAYEFKGFYASIDSMEAYFKHNMSLLKKEVRDELFADRDIFTKVRDSAPSKYGEGAIVRNSLISDGCEIEGTVENSILFRGVKVEKGAVVKNSIIMQDNIIGANASLDCVITDKNVVITNRRRLCGCEKLPYFIQKGTMI